MTDAEHAEVLRSLIKKNYAVHFIGHPEEVISIVRAIELLEAQHAAWPAWRDPKGDATFEH